MPGGASPRLPYGTISSGYALQVSLQAPFLYQVTPRRRHYLAAAMSSMGVPLASFMLHYPFWRQPNNQDWLPDSMCQPHIAAVSVDGLCQEMASNQSC